VIGVGEGVMQEGVGDYGTTTITTKTTTITKFTPFIT
jgi:hypothetical protein